MAKKKQTLEEKLTVKAESSWLAVDKKTEKKIFDFAEGYKKFLDKSKTEREVVTFIEEAARKHGFKPIASYKSLKPGDKVIITNMKKVAALAIIGKEPMEKGLKVVGSHIDSPRLDLKQKPLYEDTDSDMALFKTHYYGGIKKYQWVNVPLALHGVIIRADGKTIEVNIGEDDKDPIFVIGDLLPHLARKVQGDRKLFEGITGEELRIIIGNRPSTDKDAKNKFKTHILDILNKKYGIVEEDLISAELQAVPAHKCRDVGLDRSMIGGYGQDDRVDAYASLMAICNIQTPAKTALALFFDKEEVGSIGATGAQGGFMEYSLIQIMEKMDSKFRFATLKKALANSRALSADVDAGVDPMFKTVHELGNAAKLGQGIGICKFGGAGGKGGSNDANAEFLGEVRQLLNKHKIPWQYTELGKVDEGGGGTVARFLSEQNMQVIDVGPALISMHSPFEISSKVDVYYTYRAFQEFHNAP
ncbi:MAG: aminopeptidase [Candidatus Thermoplasmatota archaeon]|nr:aminopeptidase [Euryarchaeota archaeon]MBU4031284.1 aminopeptidase [Candidatus Thermoplasmatota archaeon]MBU4071374.1 aminopeptidase [Candidatus Thermoplasmatota archaeon]MBU4144201.1 aminopeptidase [Candidatus Thermoplasmatota archaeon]MBU4591507.1 aminopeptidase [Candidatus Thermoplasmatota archaeon]